MAFSFPHKGISPDATSAASNTFQLFYSPTGANSGVNAIGSGNAVIGFVIYFPNSTSGITVTAKDSANNTLNVPRQIDGSGISGAGSNLAVYYLQNITNAPTSVTFTASASNSASFWIAGYIEVAGMASSSPLDAAPAINSQVALTSGTNAVVSTTTGALAQTGELVYGVTWSGGGGGADGQVAITAGTNQSFTKQNDGNGIFIRQ